MNEIDKFTKSQSIAYNIPEDILNIFASRTKLIKLKKKEVFVKEGEHQKKFFFLISGIARAYIIDDSGREFTRTLFTAPAAIAPVKALKTKEETIVNFDCLTDCEMYVGNYHDFIKLTRTNIQIANLYNDMLEEAYLRIEERIYELTLSAQEKYEKLKERIPQIDNLIPQYQIATYLAITNVQLSRVRKKMLGK